MKEVAPAALGALRAEFLAAHNNRYSIEVEPPPVRDQCSFGGCWAYSTLADIETEIHTRTGKQFDLSEQYLIARNLLEKIEHALEEPGTNVRPGSTIAAAESLIQHHGMIPTAAWTPRVPFETSPHAKRMLLFMNNRIAEYHLAAAGLTAASPKRKALLVTAKADLQNLFDTYMGPLPEAFEFEGRRYTPVEFAKAFAAPAQNPVLRVVPKRDPLPAGLLPKQNGKTAPASKVKTNDRRIEEDWPAIEARIIASLRAGRAVPVSIELVNEFLDKKTGILSIGAFHTPDGFSPVDEVARTHFDIDAGNHAVDIIGVDLAPDGSVIKFKVRNSWGEAHGDHGVDHMYPDYFRAYGNYLFFR